MIPHRRTVAVVLGLQWIWSGLAYHALLFTAINPAAWGFAALFLMQGALLVVRGTRVHWLEGRGLRRTVGLALTFYGFVYPLLNIAFGHPYPATPTFGVPCPTAIVTIGLLLTVRGGPPVSLSLIPLVWSVIGGSAAMLLGVWTDYALIVAGILLAGGVVTAVVRSRRNLT